MLYFKKAVLDVFLPAVFGTHHKNPLDSLPPSARNRFLFDKLTELHTPVNEIEHVLKADLIHYGKALSLFRTFCF